VCFPLCRPRVPGAHVCHVFVATSFNATVHSDRLRRCKPPPYRIGFFQSHRAFGSGLRNSSSSTPSTRGLPGTRHSRCPIVVTWDPGRSPRRCAPSVLSMSACAGTAAVCTALPVPVASNSPPLAVPSWPMSLPTRCITVSKVAGWTPSRPPAGKSRCGCLVPSGPVAIENVFSMARVPSGLVCEALE